MDKRITFGYASNDSDDVDSPCQTQKGTPQSGSMARPTTLAYAPNNTENRDEPIHQNPMGIPESGSMARQTTLGYASSFDDDMVKTIPKGSKFWISEAKNKPMLGTTFDSIEEAFQFYKAYAIEVGFEVKRGGAWKLKKQLNPKLKFFYSVREGFKPGAWLESFHWYNMVLVPFTGIDNHNRCVSFDVALLASESSKKYTWLLTIFKKVFGNAPKMKDLRGKGIILQKMEDLVKDLQDKD
nr:FAR1 DNA binding domain, zinc finger, SWIM-type, MULE transposase domain, FHY3/FAR1 family [Tanacetum cinerariifolium]